MKSLVIELQQAALDEGSSVTGILRKAMVIAKKLRIEELEKWAALELNGYNGDADVPDYRLINGEVKSFNPYNGSWLPVLWGGGDEPPEFSTRRIVQSIPELQDLVMRSESNSSLQMNFPPAAVASLMRATDMIQPPVLFISRTSIHGIVEKVRNLLLDWSLKLEAQGIMGNDMTFTRTEIESAQAHRQIIIENFQGVLGNVSHSTVTQNLTMEIGCGDFEGLSRLLKEKGVSATDLGNLRSALDSDSTPTTPGNFGTRVSNWIGGMLQKAASGSWQISLGAAGNLLGDAVSRYYGLK